MHPVFFEVPTPWGSQVVYAYGVMLGMALIAGWFLLMRAGSRDRLHPDLLANAYLVGVVSALIGARLLFGITHLENFGSVGQWLDVRSGGLSTEGAWLGGFAGVTLYLRAKKASVLQFADAASPALALGLCLTRIGNYLHGSEFGVRLQPDAPAWLQVLGTFPRWEGALQGPPAWLHHVEVYSLAPDAGASMPVHPTQLYEAAFAAALLGLAVVMLRLRRFQGQAFLSMGVLYCAARVWFDPIVEDPERVYMFGFSLGQLVCMALFAALIMAWVHQRGRLHDQPLAAANSEG